MAVEPRAFWLIYALGGGWGHLTRAVALALAAPLGVRVRILANSPYAAQVQAAMPELDLVAFPTATSKAQAIAHIEAAAPSCLIVDTFPRGLGGELAELLAHATFSRVLVHRDLNPEYVESYGLRAFVESHYDLVLIPGVHEGSAFGGVVTAPWVLRSTHALSAPSARVLVCASGTAEELDWYGTVVSHLLRTGTAAKCVAAFCPPGCPRENWVRHWPAVDLYAGVDVVVGGGGYNTVYECLAYGVPLIARPWPRQYDRQWRRVAWASDVGKVRVVHDAEEAAALAAVSGRQTPLPSRIESGAEAAVESLLRFAV